MFSTQVLKQVNKLSNAELLKKLAVIATGIVIYASGLAFSSMLAANCVIKYIGFYPIN